MDATWQRFGIIAYLCGLVYLGTAAPTPTTQPHRKDPLEYFVLEKLPANTPVSNVAIDAWLPKKYNQTILSELTYVFENNDPKLYLFEIDAKTSIVKTTEQIDRDKLCPKVELCVVWIHVGVLPDPYAETIKIRLEIVDENDHKPRFVHDEMALEVLESTPVSTSQWILPLAIDEDSTSKYGVQDYELATENKYFMLIKNETRVGSELRIEIKLELSEPLDREKEEFVQLKVVAYDGGNPPKSGSMLINVTVKDANDNDPKFDNATYEFFVMENIPASTIVGLVHAVDKDLGSNGEITYALSEVAQEQYGHLFGIREKTGYIYQKQSLDFEKDSTYLIVVTAQDNGPNSKPGHSTVIIRVVDANDNAPTIMIESEMAEVRETQREGAFVAHFTVSDQDGGDNGKVECHLDHNKFTLQSVYQSQYRVVTTARLNYDDSAEYELMVVCNDLGKVPNVAMQNIIVSVLDENDNPPEFIQQVYQSHIGENNNIGDMIIQVKAIDNDDERFGEVEYSLGPDANNDFAIDPKTGVITANKVFDYEFIQEERFTVLATDLGAPPMTATASVIVSILDLNDETPNFTQDRYEFGIFENQPLKTDVGNIELDLHEVGDIDLAGLFTYSFANPSSTDSLVFNIDPKNGKITTNAELDREEKPVYYLTVIATNEGFPPMTGSVSVTVYVADKNDNRPFITYPTINNKTVTISSHAPVGYHVAPIQATDKDIGDNAQLSYSITQGNEGSRFQINSATGVISVIKDLSHIQTVDYDLSVIVKDNGFPQQAALARLHIVVNQSIAFIPEEPTKAVVGKEHATVIISVTAACLVLVFVVLFSIMMYLVWKRFSPSLKKKKAEKYCYSNMQRPFSGLSPEDQRDINRGVAEGEEADDPDNNANIAVTQYPIASSSTSPSPYNGPASSQEEKCNVVKASNSAFTMDNECLQREPALSNINTSYPQVDKNIPKNKIRVSIIIHILIYNTTKYKVLNDLSIRY